MGESSPDRQEEGDPDEPPRQRRKLGPPSPTSANTAIQAGSCSEEDLLDSTEPGEHDFGVDTASLTDSVRDHVFEGGLRYHAYRSGKYAFPNDESEQMRDEMKHEMSVELCGGKYFFAPVESALDRGAEVLDLGTGTGAWCVELADNYTRSSFLGIDLSPIQPADVPPNLQFVIDDIEHENGWEFENNQFDYIHLRHTLHSIRDRKELYARVLKHLKPGGYFEIQELEFIARCDDDSCTDETPYAFRNFLEYLHQGLAALGSDLLSIRVVADEMREAGFEDVTSHMLKNPIGAWAKRKDLRVCGMLLRESILNGLKGLASRPFTALAWTPMQIEIFLVQVRRDVRNAEFHTYLPFRAVCGRKPL